MVFRKGILFTALVVLFYGSNSIGQVSSVGFNFLRSSSLSNEAFIDSAKWGGELRFSLGKFTNWNDKFRVEFRALYLRPYVQKYHVLALNNDDGEIRENSIIRHTANISRMYGVGASLNYSIVGEWNKDVVLYGMFGACGYNYKYEEQRDEELHLSWPITYYNLDLDTFEKYILKLSAGIGVELVVGPVNFYIETDFQFNPLAKGEKVSSAMHKTYKNWEFKYADFFNSSFGFRFYF